MTETRTDTFEIWFRLGGSEVAAMGVSSQSKTRNMIMFGVISFILLLLTIAELTPELVQAYRLLRGEI